MKFTKFLAGIAICSTAAILIVSCQKERSFDPSNPPVPVTESNARLSGVVGDNPASINKVPVIISSDFLKQNKDFPSLIISGNEARVRKDITAPTVSINSPAAGATVSGAISIQITASDNVGIYLVSLAVDGATVDKLSTAPFTFLWNSATVINGTHTLNVTARDAAGNSKSVSIQINVNNIAPGDITSPTVSITSPSNSSSVTGTVSITANASDNISVNSVKFSVDGTLVGTSTSSPYSFSWNTSTVAAGVRTVTATASDAAGNSSTHSIQVTVNTIILPPPPVTLPASAQLLMPPVENQGGEGSCVPFATVYAARSVEQFYKTSASTYSFSTNIFSPEFLYDQIKTTDCGSGTGVITALDFLVSTGVCTWQSMPYSSSNGCSIIPTSAQSTEAANYKITSYSKIPVTDITAIKTMVVNKHAIIITVGTDNSFWGAQPGFIWKVYSGPMGISHTLVICGYDDAKHAYKVMNSWGTTWGDAGYSWIDYDFLPQCSAYYSYVIAN